MTKEERERFDIILSRLSTMAADLRAIVERMNNLEVWIKKIDNNKQYEIDQLRSELGCTKQTLEIEIKRGDMLEVLLKEHK